MPDSFYFGVTPGYLPRRITLLLNQGKSYVHATLNVESDCLHTRFHNCRLVYPSVFGGAWHTQRDDARHTDLCSRIIAFMGSRRGS